MSNPVHGRHTGLLARRPEGGPVQLPAATRPGRRHCPGFIRRLVAGAAMAAMLSAGGMAAASLMATAAAETHLLFGTTSTRYQGLTPFPKWTGALERYFARRGNMPGSCDENRFNRCHYQRWQDLKAELKSAPPDVQLRRINDFMNRYRYIIDPINWGVKDYWESPDQFFAKYGDCEDYAIAKYFSLRALGWPADRLKIVVLQDLNLNIAHAVLVVDHDGKSLVLDNQIAIIVEQSRIHHYRPIYSVNETGWWRHKPIPADG
jgi:predicted transglutaminase-like cysteine proteinase